MLENRRGFVNLIKNEIPEVAASPCIFHRHALVVKTLFVTLKNEINSCVKIVNYVRGRALNQRLFKAFCSDLDDDASVCCFIQTSGGSPESRS